MAMFDIAPGLRFCARAAWGADPRLPRLGAPVPRTARTHVFVHHSTLGERDATPALWETEAGIFAAMRTLQRCRPDLGLDVPYSFVAFLAAPNDGLYICEGRGEDRSGAHTVGHNSAAIGIAFAGDFENRPPAPDAIARRMPALSRFLGWLRHECAHPGYAAPAPMELLDSRHPAGRAVWFHSDVKATACPGRHLKPHLEGVIFAPPGG
ncbi:N-acetylmuramoyl-L-alanine amidase [Sphingomonas canadensis]|uniref:N-acetylmuramoyl-L-alanine amidase n=1 Tax=Sphingomonas canadensis TaxID=1219257 RepID=A0ABW3H438_9SPHN|nr:N-acetylmuramoyl-L-alanine amidase [Sphingomonas canadensis]MCW3835925.1 N-acetylmuramoyl-L-alanine amidase [Sphingomonas canadensis]